MRDELKATLHQHNIYEYYDLSKQDYVSCPVYRPFSGLGRAVGPAGMCVSTVN